MLENALLNGGLYVDVHTLSFPGGEIRDQLHVAEPASLALMALELAGIAGVRRRTA